MKTMDWQSLLNAQRQNNEGKTTNEGGRSAFERDFDRIIFSSAFRRLQDKTQVIPLSESDYVRTRLTHSLEVSCVGRSLGTMVGAQICDKTRCSRQCHPSDVGAIVAAACLGHDMGNPPFGHAGEDAIRSWFQNSRVAKTVKERISVNFRSDLREFEGNAQGFRLLSKLLLPDNPGLELTYATLGAFTKYPIESCVPRKPRCRWAEANKYGFFQSEKEIFKIVAEKTGLLRRDDRYFWWCRHPLAFLVEAADDICYRINDFEDGFRLGFIEFEDAEKRLRELGGDGIKAGKLDSIKAPEAKIQYLRAVAIGTLIRQVAEKFLDLEGSILNGRFDKTLISVLDCGEVLDEILDMTRDRVYRSAGVVEIEAAGFEVIGGLLDVFVASLREIVDSNGKHRSPDPRSKKLIQLVPEQFLLFSGTPREFNSKLMGIVDFVCGMTDSYAVSLYKKIKGISLP